MSGRSITQPGVEVEQEFEAATTVLVPPNQQTVLVGACLQNVSALDDNGLPIPQAYAGAYRDGYGVIAYGLPNLSEGALVTSFLEDIRVFLRLGSVTRELHSEYDEESVYSGTSGSIDGTGFADLVLTDAGVNFLLEGIVAGDVVRFTYQGQEFDVVIASASATQLALSQASATSVLALVVGNPTSIALASYEVIRNAREFEYQAAASQARVTRGGSASDYLTLRVKADAPSAWLGGNGDGIEFHVRQQPAYVEDTLCFTGHNIFYTNNQDDDFTDVVAPVGVVSGNFFLAWQGIGGGAVLRQVLRVVSPEILIIESGANTSWNQWFIVGEQIDTGTNGATGGGDETAFTSAGQNFTTSIQNTAGSPDDDTYIEIAGVGVFQVTAVVSDTALTISAGAGTGLSGKTYTIVSQVAGSSGGVIPAPRAVCFVGGGLTPEILTDRAIILRSDGTDWEGSLFEHSPNSAPWVGAYIAYGSDNGDFTQNGETAVTGAIVDANTDALWQWEPDTKVLTFLAGRDAAGLTEGGLAEGIDGKCVVEALSQPLDAAYDITVASIFEAIENGDVSSATFSERNVRAAQWDLVLDGGALEGDLLLDKDLLGSTTPTALVYVSYKALRLDVTAAAENPLFYEITSTADIAAYLGSTADNPLAIAAEKCLANSPTKAFRVLGVSEVSPSAPYGTSAAFLEAFGFLAAKDVYTIVALTQDPVVGQYLEAHVDAMSAPTEKSERIGLVNSAMPLFTQADVIASGTTGNTGTVSGDATASFSASADFLLAEARAGDILVVAALSAGAAHLDSVDGTIGPLYGATITGVDGSDNYVLVFNGTAFPNTWDNLVDVTWTLYRPGASVSVPADQAEAIAALAEGYANRRIVHVWPDEVTGPINSIDSIMPGFFAGAAVGGKINQKKPAQPLTNETIAGFTAASHSGGYFTKAQLDRMAGGGNFILYQRAEGQPLTIRQQLTTDTSSIAKRELSVTTAIDYISRVYRETLSAQIGTVNITDELLTDIAAKCEGINAAMREQRVCRSARLLSVSEDENQADKILIEVDVRALIPNNYNRVRILI